MKTEAFCSWSGGKESSLALYRMVEGGEMKIKGLVNMVNEDQGIGHGLPAESFKTQAEAIDLPIYQRKVTWETYERNFKQVVEKIDVDHGIFGDVELEGHREWVEKVCEKLEVDPVLPLWGEDPKGLYHEFCKQFESVIIKIDAEKIDRGWLGEPLTKEFLDHLSVGGIHPLGEKGEYHTYVTDGPLFNRSLNVRKKGKKDIPDSDDVVLRFEVE